MGGGGGAAGGEGTADGGGGGAAADGFLEVIGGGGGFATLGGGGGARGGSSELDRKGASEFGLWAGFGGGFLRFATSGLAAADGCGGEDSVVCGLGLKAFNLGAVGGFGAEEVGGFGADCLDVSGSDMYDDSRSAPVSTPPPVFLSFGIPTPAKIPPNCGAALAPLLSPLPVVSLLLLARFDLPVPAPGTGGARPIGGLLRPGTAGAPPFGGPAEAPDVFPTMGADRSFVTAFFNLAPLVISVRRAPWNGCQCSARVLEGSAASLRLRNCRHCRLKQLPFKRTRSFATVGSGLAGSLLGPRGPPGGGGGGGGPEPPNPGIGGGGGGGGGGAGMLLSLGLYYPIT